MTFIVPLLRFNCSASDRVFSLTTSPVWAVDFGSMSMTKTFVLRDRLVAHAFGNDVDVAFGKLDGRRLLHLDAEAAFEDEEEFVFVRVIVPHERTVDLCDLDVRIVERGDDARQKSSVSDAATFLGDSDSAACLTF